MKITFLCVGQVKKAPIREAVSDYVKRIGKYSPMEVVEVKEESASLKMPKDDILKKEGERILGKLKEGDFVIVLADSGKGYTSKGFSAFLEKLIDRGTRSAVFIVGGAWGLHQKVYDSAQMTLSLSEMTLPHDLARLFLAEQVYRAFTIMRAEPYSH